MPTDAAARTTARIAAFMPDASPPLVRMPICRIAFVRPIVDMGSRIGLALRQAQGEREGVQSRARAQPRSSNMAVRATRSLKSRRWAGVAAFAHLVAGSVGDADIGQDRRACPQARRVPATPVMPTPMVAPERSRAASAMAMAHSPETAPCFSMISAGTPIAIFISLV